MKEKEHNDEGGVEEVEVSASSHTGGRGRNRDLFLPISILVAAVMVAGAILFATLYKGGIAPAVAVAPGDGGNGGAAVATTTISLAQAMVLGPRDAILGSANAPVTLIEYGDYQCPYCGEFFSETEPQIIQNYVSTGKVRMVFRDFAFLGAESTAAANAAQCAEDQNSLWAYHDALYSAKVADDNKGGTEDDNFFTTTELLKLAKQINLNIPTFTTCITSSTDAAIVTQEKTDGANAGINSTPTFLLNGQMITGAEPYSVFQQALNAALQG